MSQAEIEFDPVTTDTRRDRTERAVLARLAAIQALGESDAVIAPTSSRLRWVAAGLAGAAVAVALALWLDRRDAQVVTVAESPSLVVTPIGGSSRFTVGDAVIEAGGDTSVEVNRDSGGGIALQLTRGRVECDVTPRPGRPPFRVLAADVVVEVVGTRFSVLRSEAGVRVDVTRGKVRVKAPYEERLLEAGGSWASSRTTSSEPIPPARGSAVAVEQGGSQTPSPGADAPPSPPPPRTSAAPPPSTRAAFAAAQRLEPSDPVGAARAYRNIAHGRDVWAALSLYSLAELHATRDPASALPVLDELARRFPGGANAEDAAWLRVTVLRALDRQADARQAAASYLRAYPNGTYVTAAERLASP